MKMQNCICGSEKPFEKCCHRFLSGNQHAKTPEQLMRSRYAAYALGGHGAYLLNTWFPATSMGLKEEELDKKRVSWQKLEVLDKNQKGDNGTVEFKAYFLKPGHDMLDVMHEKSTFKRNGGYWFYVGGEVN
jgi:SEC-C motif-containing protein